VKSEKISRIGLPALLLAASLCCSMPASAQPFGGPPAVGVVAVARQPVYQASDYVGRVQSVERVNLVARVTAFIDQRLFTEGAEVKKGDMLYRLEQGPFQADIQAKQATVAQFKAQLVNANLTLARVRALLNTPAGQQANVDSALANQLSIQAQLQGAEAQLRQSEINLDYTEIRAPIDGKIGRSTLTVGNVVSPSSGVLATIVSQDPMYVVFPVSVRAVLDLRRRYADKGGFAAAVLKLRLPSGQLYAKTGTLDFVDNTVATTTDTMTLRGAVPNPPVAESADTNGPTRELVDNEVVNVVLEDATPIEALVVPRAAVLSDQRGNYVYVVDAENKAQQRRIELGQTTPSTAVVTNGLAVGEKVVLEGIQRVRPGAPVVPAPAGAPPPVAASGSSHP
jgi:membrane fusion protein, multidrug efflux system